VCEFGMFTKNSQKSQQSYTCIFVTYLRVTLYRITTLLRPKCKDVYKMFTKNSQKSQHKYTCIFVTYLRVTLYRITTLLRPKCKDVYKMFTKNSQNSQKILINLRYHYGNVSPQLFYI